MSEELSFVRILTWNVSKNPSGKTGQWQNREDGDYGRRWGVDSHEEKSLWSFMLEDGREIPNFKAWMSPKRKWGDIGAAQLLRTQNRNWAWLTQNLEIS